MAAPDSSVTILRIEPPQPVNIRTFTAGVTLKTARRLTQPDRPRPGICRLTGAGFLCAATPAGASSATTGARHRWRGSWRRRSPPLLLRYLEAYALHSAGIVEAKSIHEAAGIDKRTAASYESVLENVFVVESLPAWRTNRIKRLTQMPKRYILDAGLMAAILRVDMTAILRDEKLLGRVIDTFVVSQLRGEIEVCATRPRLYHLRDTDNRREADIVAELSGERVLAFEIKASSAATASDARHLAWMRDQLGDRFIGGVVFHTGPHVFPLGDQITALPISAIWAAR